MFINIRKENINTYIDDIVKIHHNAYHDDHFVSLFSNNKLINYYFRLITENDYCYVYEENEKKLGFIVAGKNTRQPINDFINENKFYLLMMLIKNPSFIFVKAYQFFHRYFVKKKKFNVKSSLRLLSIAVDTTNQSKGIGGKMLKKFEENLIKCNEESYGLSVRKTNTDAIRFYHKNNLKLEFKYQGLFFFNKELN